MTYKIEHVSSQKGDPASIASAVSKIESQVRNRMSQGLHPIGPVQIVLDGQGGFFAYQTLASSPKE